MRVESLTIASREDRHLVRLRLALMVEEDIEIGRDDVAQDGGHRSHATGANP